MFWKRKRKRKMARHLCNQLVCDGDAKWAKGNWWSSSVAHLHGHLTTKKRGGKKAETIDRLCSTFLPADPRPTTIVFSPPWFHRHLHLIWMHPPQIEFETATNLRKLLREKLIYILFPPSYGIKIYFLIKKHMHSSRSLSQSLYSIDADIHSWFIL